MSKTALAYAAVFYAAFGWALSPVFMRYLSTAYDPFTQSFVRYFSSTIVLLPVSLLFFPAETRRLFRRSWALAGLAMLNVVDMVVWTIACYSTTATAANLITKLQVPFVIVLSFLLFHEERAVIRSPLYVIGTTLSILGVAVFVSANSAASAMPRFGLASVMLVFVALGWAAYAVWGKHLVTNTHPVPMFAVVTTHSTLGLLPIALMAGDFSTAWQAPPFTTFIAFCSGVFPIALAHCTFHYGQKVLGAAFTNSITLIGPLITYGFALALWSDEWLVPLQWGAAAALLLGSYLVVQAQRKSGHTPKPTPATPAPAAPS